MESHQSGDQVAVRIHLTAQSNEPLTHADILTLEPLTNAIQPLLDVIQPFLKTVQPLLE